MKIHEHQGKELFRKYGVPVPNGGPAFTVEEALKVADSLSGYPLLVKAQIHAGGRGKGGGVKLAKNREECEKYIKQILGMNLVTKQTGPEGKLVRRLLIEEGCKIRKELYLGILPDRSNAKICIMASEAGGMSIEEVAAATPEKIIKVFVDPLVGIQGYHCRQTAFGLNIPAACQKQFMQMLTGLYKLLVEYDCSLVEINPLVLTEDDKVLAIDAKVTFDDNALFRHKDIKEFRDISEEDALEVEASKFDLNYIKLDGNVGNMVNGAGLAMATMDVIKLAGADPANFLDVGGGANAEQIKNAFKIMLSDKNVKAVLINIFGGILRCDRLAEGVVQAAKQVGIKVPVVIRMEGTNVEIGRKILAESGLQLINAVSMQDAAEKVAKTVA